MAKVALFCTVVLVLASCGIAWAEETGEAAGPGAGIFSGSFGDALWTVIWFVVLALVLGTVAWKPLLNGLNARQTHIEQQLKSAEDSRVKAEHMLDEYKQQGLEVVRQAGEHAQRHYQEMAEKAREETLVIRRRAHEEIESAQATAMEDLWKRTGDIVLQVGSEVLGRTLTEKDNQRLIDEAVARIRQNGGLR